MKKYRPYFPGVVLFLFAMVLGMLTYQDYGVSWDEPIQREIGIASYDFAFNHNPALKTQGDRNYGPAFEMPLIFIEKWMHLTDSRDIYLMRHIATHLFFLFSVLCAYVLVYRLFRSQFLACLGFIMLALTPRIYAHSFFNTKDIPFLSAVIILFTLFQLAFRKNKTIYYILLAAISGYATSIRVMGIMYVAFIVVLLVKDLLAEVIGKKSPAKPIIHIAAFLLSFCVALNLSWPYLWDSPWNNFKGSFSEMAHFPWQGPVLFSGKVYQSTALPWTYFPEWFLISNSPLWLLMGCCGIILVVIAMVRHPRSFLGNTPDRNYLLYLFGFFAPVLSVILLHSVIYDDWRHLYFVYPSFVLLALYAVNKLRVTRWRPLVVTACLIQTGFICYFMVNNHPFEQIYFNSFVSHKPEYLRKHYELDYWGCSYKQGLDYIVTNDHRDLIKVRWDMNPLLNNVMLLQPRDRSRIARVVDDPDYAITNFRGTLNDPPFPAAYRITVLNSTILCVYKLH